MTLLTIIDGFDVYDEINRQQNIRKLNKENCNR